MSRTSRKNEHLQHKKAGDRWSPLRKIILSIVGATIGRPPRRKSIQTKPLFVILVVYFLILLQKYFFLVFLFSSFQHLFILPLIFFRHFLKKPFTFFAFCVIIWGEIETIIFYLIYTGGFISNGY